MKRSRSLRRFSRRHIHNRQSLFGRFPGLLPAIKVCGVLIALYFICAPLVPGFFKYVALQFDSTKGYRYAGVHTESLIQNGTLDKNELKPKPDVNTLVIPKIGVDAQVYESTNEQVLEMGIWRRPGTGTPEKGGNTVLAAHRYQRISGPNTFYFLDKLEKGDEMILYWDEQEYVYEVFETEVVEPTRTDIEDPTNDDILTLYTCTPLWTGTDRLVIRAKVK